MDYLALLAKHPNSTLRELDRLTTLGRAPLIAGLESLRSHEPPLAECPRMTDRWRLTPDGQRIHDAGATIAAPDEPDPRAEAPKVKRVPLSEQLYRWLPRVGQATVEELKREFTSHKPESVTCAADELVRRELAAKRFERHQTAAGWREIAVYSWVGHGDPG